MTISALPITIFENDTDLYIVYSATNFKELEFQLDAKQIIGGKWNSIILPRPFTVSPWQSKATDIIGIPIERCLKSNHFDKMSQVQLTNVDYSQFLKFINENYQLSNHVYNDSNCEEFMIKQLNSEHCRHHTFRAHMNDTTLMKMIQSTYDNYPSTVLSAYKDNAAVIKGVLCDNFSSKYELNKDVMHVVLKVETHNHPTAVSPYPGAATGSGGEIRDEIATGRGAKVRGALSGFTTNHLRLSSSNELWEDNKPLPAHLASAKDIMIEGPIGAARYNNEFGRPLLCGYFRTFDATINNQFHGYSKPVMLAGGIGIIRDQNVHKQALNPNDFILVLGGPGMLIGLGGGSSSSTQLGNQSIELDYASVQRENAEMQRRCTSVVDSLADASINIIKSIHDVGAGGLCNAIPELVHDCDRGGVIYLNKIPVSDASMSPTEIWCNESQERYVLGIDPSHYNLVLDICKRENCPVAHVGTVTEDRRLVLLENESNNIAIFNVDLTTVFASQRRTIKLPSTPNSLSFPIYATPSVPISDLINNVLHYPAVGSKSFLITINDRSIGGHVIKEPMQGQFQIPITDCGLTTTSFTSNNGVAMSLGERPIISLINPIHSVEMALGEALLNMACCRIKLDHLVASANWMVNSDAKNTHGDYYNGGLECKALFDGVSALSNLCKSLNICIPVGKDSMSMSTTYNGHTISSPMTCNITLTSPVTNVKTDYKPQGFQSPNESIYIIEASSSVQAMGASVIEQITNKYSNETPHCTSEFIIALFKFIDSNWDNISAIHDRSDGGLFTTMVEMTMPSKIGCTVDLHKYNKHGDLVKSLFNEELGLVISTKTPLNTAIVSGLSVTLLGQTINNQNITITNQQQSVYTTTINNCFKSWSTTTHAIKSIRDSVETADAETEAYMTSKIGLTMPPCHVTLPITTNKKKVAILREQGINGNTEMAYAFQLGGYSVVDVHTSDLIDGKYKLSDFDGGIAICGGFSYGDTLGAGRGWALKIYKLLKQQFVDYIKEERGFVLGVCNGCQMMSWLLHYLYLDGDITEEWPLFTQNKGKQFEGRQVMVKVLANKSQLSKNIHGIVHPIHVAHGEGLFKSIGDKSDEELYGELHKEGRIMMEYVDPNTNKATTQYPFNPNGSIHGVAGVCSGNGKIALMMPHPERGIMQRQYSFLTEYKEEYTAWMNMFINSE